jgi:hypothetical protein
VRQSRDGRRVGAAFVILGGATETRASFGMFGSAPPFDKRAFLMLSISQNHPSAESAVFVVAFIPASSASKTLIFGVLLRSTAAAGQRTSFDRS